MTTLRLAVTLALYLAVGTFVQLAPRSERRGRIDAGGPK